MKGISTWTPHNLFEHVNSVQATKDGKTYFPARPIGCDCIRCRLRATWRVFTGRADVLVWPEGQ